MTPLPAPITAGAEVVAWRIDADSYASSWDSGVGAERVGGRWSPKGIRAVYCSFDPATTILESAVHRGFPVLDIKPFTLTCMKIMEPADVHVVWPKDVPNPAWLQSGILSAGQQVWGASLLDSFLFIAIPSAVSKLSWNLIFRPDRATGKYVTLGQDRLVLDTRLNPKAP